MCARRKKIEAFPIVGASVQGNAAQIVATFGRA
jgi:hypothetical protein